jgi:hypothetical protein
VVALHLLAPVCQPGADALAAELRILSTSWNPSLWRHLYLDGSWPLAACLAAGQTEADLLRLAERAERGEMGSLDDWICAEQRWQQSGISDEDLIYLSGARWPFDAQIGKLSFPFSVATVLNVEARRSQHAFDGWHGSCPGICRSPRADRAASNLSSFCRSREPWSTS